MLLPGTHGGYLGLKPGLGVPQIAVFGRFDQAKGVPLAEPQAIIPGLSSLPPAAFSPSGILAARKPGATTVELWDPGAKASRSLTVGPAVEVGTGWLDWAADGKLLVLGADRLSGWDVAAGKRVFEVEGKFRSTAALDPARRWLAVGIDRKYLEARDVFTGGCPAGVSAGSAGRAGGFC